MQLVSGTALVAGCVLFATAGAGLAKQPTSSLQAEGQAAQGAPGVQCTDKADLTNIVATMGRVDYLAGGNPQSVSDDVLMIDFNLSVENAGGVEAGQSRIEYSANIKTVGGALVERVGDTMDIYSLAPGETTDNLVTVMVSKLAALAAPSGGIEATIVFHAVIDVDNEIAECDETDNVAEVTSALKLDKSVL